MASRLPAEFGAAAAVFALGAAGVAGALEHETGWAADGPQAGFFPLRLGILLMAAATGIALTAWIGRRRLLAESFADPAALRRVAGLLVPIAAFVLVSVIFGLYAGMALYLVAVIRWGGRHGWGTALGVGIGTAAASYVIFETWFRVPLLKGPVEAWLGLA